MTHRPGEEEKWQRCHEEPGRRSLMQWKWMHQVLEQVVLTALKVSLTIQ